jgi:hypothetical protein
MQPRRSPRFRTARHDLRDLLSAYLVLFLGFAPVLGLAHLAAGDHFHRFCEEHQQIEDVARTPQDNRDRRPTLPPAGENRTSLRGGVPGPLGDTHVACSFLNHAPARASLPSPTHESDVVLQKRAVPESLGRGKFSPRPLLLSAPKTSPPFVA